MNVRTLANATAVVLCGGKGRRLGAAGEHLPKALVAVRGKPILWYILLRLHQDGFRHFVLPLGYLGKEIRRFVESELGNLDAVIDLVETGEDTPAGRRLSLVRHTIRSPDFLLVNGDTLFDFDVAGLIAGHRASGADLTLATCSPISPFGLLLVDDSGRAVDFLRNAVVAKFLVAGSDHRSGFVYAGIAALSRHTLEVSDIDTTPDFEQHLYPQIATAERARHYPINGFWHAIDTQKDLDAANSTSEEDPRARGTRILTEKLSAYLASSRIRNE